MKISGSITSPRDVRRIRPLVLGVSGGDGTATLEEPARATELKGQARKKLEEASSLAETAEAAKRDFTADERTKVKALVDEAADLKRQADQVIADAKGDSELRAAIDNVGKGLVETPGLTIPGRESAGQMSLGERFTTDDAVTDWLKAVAPTGAVGEKTRLGQSPAVGFRGLRDLDAFGRKDVITGGSDTSAGALVASDWRGLLDAGWDRRPLAIRDLVTVGQTTSDTVEYAREVSATNNAEPVPEASGSSSGTESGDVAGTKPESELELEKVSETVKTIAHWVPATKRALSDAAQVRTLIDSFLRYGLDEELEDQMVDGDGTGENFEGILTVSGTTPQAWDTDILVTTRKARTKVKTVGRAIPTAYVFNPADNERIDLTKDDNGGFYFGGPASNGVQTLWGLPRVESEAVPEGQGIVADWRRAILWDREQAAISVSDSHADFFVRNLVAILAELRAAFGVIRPAAFVVIDLTA